MAKINPSGLPGSIAILGLVIERPDRTVADIADELDERFAEAQYDPATANHTIKRMVSEDNPRLEFTHKEPGRSRRDDRFGPTAVGLDEFENWMRMSPLGVPAVREALYGRMELCRGPEDLPDLIRMADEESLIAKKQFNHSKGDFTHELERRRRRRGQGEFADFLQDIQKMLLNVGPEYWSERSIHFDAIATKLEAIARREGIQFKPPRR